MPGRKGRKKLYQFVDALVATGAREMVARLGTKDELAAEVMRDIAHAICVQYGKTIMYVPEDIEFKLSLRDQEIWTKYGQDGPDGARKYTPHRVAQLAEEYDRTTAHIYVIVRRMHGIEVAGRQGRLEGFENDVEAVS